MDAHERLQLQQQTQETLDSCITKSTRDGYTKHAASLLRWLATSCRSAVNARFLQFQERTIDREKRVRGAVQSPDCQWRDVLVQWQSTSKFEQIDFPLTQEFTTQIFLFYLSDRKNYRTQEQISSPYLTQMRSAVKELFYKYGMPLPNDWDVVLKRFTKGKHMHKCMHTMHVYVKYECSN
jgi:hypothetical protein